MTAPIRTGDFWASGVRFGKPGLLRVAPIGTAEPTTEVAPWPDGWVALGYTDEGSVVNYEISTDNVEVAEELDVFARVTTGRDASVEMALAEITYFNLSIAFNGGVLDDAFPGPQDGEMFTFEPPALGNEERIMLGWDAHPDPAKNDLRYIFRKCLQGGTVSMENRKGTTKQTIPVTFQLEKPDDGRPLMVIMGGPKLNPKARTATIVATGANAGTPGTFTPAGATAPANLAALQGGSVVASPPTAWTTGQHVVLGDSSQAHWDSDSWESGAAS